MISCTHKHEDATAILTAEMSFDMLKEWLANTEITIIEDKDDALSWLTSVKK